LVWEQTFTAISVKRAVCIGKNGETRKSVQEVEGGFWNEKVARYQETRTRFCWGSFGTKVTEGTRNREIKGGNGVSRKTENDAFTRKGGKKTLKAKKRGTRQRSIDLGIPTGAMKKVGKDLYGAGHQVSKKKKA